jgi:hypothetical protein
MLSLVTVFTLPYQSTHGRFEVVLGNVDGVVSFDSVCGKVLDIGSISVRLFHIANCLENSSDPNYFVTFVENSIDLHGCPTAISDTLFQDGTLLAIRKVFGIDPALGPSAFGYVLKPIGAG